MTTQILKQMIILFLFATLFSEDNELSVSHIKQNLNDQFSTIEDFSVDINLSVKMTGLRMPRKKVKLFFKQPDLTKIESKGFALVPQYGLPLSPEFIFDTLSDVIIDSIDGRNHLLVMSGALRLESDGEDIWNISENSSNTVRMRLSIDSKNWLITGFTILVDDTEFLRSKMDYTKHEDGIFFPEQTRIELSIPEEEEIRNFHMRDGSAPQEGTITLQFSNFKWNQGLNESFFLEEAD